MDDREALLVGPQTPGGTVVGDEELCGVDGRSFTFTVPLLVGWEGPDSFCVPGCTR